MLALTVGSITTAAAAAGLLAWETVARVPMGKPGWPSPFTRVGPGLGGAIKPELVERGGTLGIESGRIVDNDAELGVISASAIFDRLLSFSIGSSFSAPLVTRIAAAVQARFPGFSSNMVRALVLCSAEFLDIGSEFDVAREIDRIDAVHRLSGFGRPNIARAIESTSHRVVLVGEDRIAIDGVHIYELPVPASFRESGGLRGIDVALAYDPRTRARRLDYMANHMEFYLVRGLALEDVVASFARLDPSDETDLESEEEVEAEMPAGDEAVSPPTPSGLGSRVCKLVPSKTARSRGANQLGRVTFSQRFATDRHEPVHLVVRNVNRWDDPTATQTYAVAVAMWRSEAHGELYADLEAQLEAVIEVPVEIEITT
jgi:hypothetical protein